LYTFVSFVKPVGDFIVWSIHEVVGLGHYGFLHHLVPGHKHHLFTAEADAEHLSIDVSQLRTMNREKHGDKPERTA